MELWIKVINGLSKVEGMKAGRRMPKRVRERQRINREKVKKLLDYENKAMKRVVVEGE